MYYNSRVKHTYKLCTHVLYIAHIVYTHIIDCITSTMRTSSEGKPSTVCTKHFLHCIVDTSVIYTMSSWKWLLCLRIGLIICTYVPLLPW